MPYQLRKNFKLFTLNSNPELAQEIADLLGCEMGKSSITRFSDGEVQINIEESVRGAEVYLIQSTRVPVKVCRRKIRVTVSKYYF